MVVAEFKIPIDGAITFDRCNDLCRHLPHWFKLANNTWIQESTVSSGAYGIKLHQTEILTVYPDGRYRLNAGGHHSRTTCDRLNRLSPVRCKIKDGVIVAEGIGPLFQPTVILPGDDGWTEEYGIGYMAQRGAA